MRAGRRRILTGQTLILSRSHLVLWHISLNTVQLPKGFCLCYLVFACIALLFDFFDLYCWLRSPWGLGATSVSIEKILHTCIRCQNMRGTFIFMSAGSR